MKIHVSVGVDRKVVFIVTDDSQKVVANMSIGPDDAEGLAENIQNCVDIARGGAVPPARQN